MYDHQQFITVMEASIPNRGYRPCRSNSVVDAEKAYGIPGGVLIIDWQENWGDSDFLEFNLGRYDHLNNMKSGEIAINRKTGELVGASGKVYAYGLTNKKWWDPDSYDGFIIEGYTEFDLDTDPKEYIRYATEDFQRAEDFINDKWTFASCTVNLFVMGRKTETDSLHGIESDSGQSYFIEVEDDLCAGCVYQFKKRLPAILSEMEEAIASLRTFSEKLQVYHDNQNLA
jgi:hypothetical protein